MDTGQPVQLAPQGALNVAVVGEFHRQLVAALAGSDRVTVDLAGASAIDAAFLQLLCSAHRTAVAGGKELELVVADGAAVIPLLAIGGFRRHIGCTLDCHGSCIWMRTDAASALQRQE